MPSLRLLCALSMLSGSAQGFLFNAVGYQQTKTANPALLELAQAQRGIPLNVCLNVGVNQESRMSINGLVLELNQEPVNDMEHTALPGANGPNARTSTGAKSLHIKNDAYFIDLNGMQRVALEDGCWEMIWREGAPSGVLVCGFHVPKEVRRNEASIPAGRLYMSLPVWTKAGLAEYQARRRNVEATAKQYMEKKKEALQSMESTNNPLMKALHFRNAAEATEKYQNMGATSMEKVPLDEDVTPILGDLLLAKEGLVWTKEESFFGAEHPLLGTVTVKPEVTNDDAE